MKSFTHTAIVFTLLISPCLALEKAKPWNEMSSEQDKSSEKQAKEQERQRKAVEYIKSRFTETYDKFKDEITVMSGDSYLTESGGKPKWRPFSEAVKMQLTFTYPGQRLSEPVQRAYIVSPLNPKNGSSFGTMPFMF